MWRNRTIANGPTEERVRDRMLLGDAVGSPSLDLVFTSGVLDSSRIDFQRTTAGTFYRGQFNQNRIFPSEDLTTSWTNGGLLAFGSGSVANDPAVAAPNGTFTAEKVIENTALGDHRSFRSVGGLQTGQVFTASVYLKAAGRNLIGMWETLVGGSVFDLANGTVFSNSAGVTSSIEAVGNGWYRCSITLATGGTSFTLQIRGSIAGNFNYTGDGTSGWYVWGAQLTEGSLLTPYIPTTTAAITEGQIASSALWNLLLRSQEFDNTTTWTNSIGGTGINPVRTANNAVAPDGTTTADTITFNTGANTTSSDFSFVQQTPTFTAGIAHTMSFWIRGTVGGEKLTVRHVSGGSYTLVTATTSWQRITITETANAGANVQIGIRQNVSGHGVINSTATVEFWGAQINEGSTALEYRSTTSSALWLPRFQNNPVTGNAEGLLIEGGATNLMQQSAAVRTSPWSVSNLTTIGPSITAPDGTTNGVEIVATNGSGPGAGQTLQIVSGISATTAYTTSVFFKPKGTAVNTQVIVRARNGGTFLSDMSVVFDHATGTVGSITSGTWTATSATSTNVGNGWYRFTFTGTTPATTTNIVVFLMNANTGNGTDGVYAWGAQVEAQAFASSYIPTTTASVARGADSAVMSGTNFSSWYNQSEGAVLCEMSGLPLGLVSGRAWQIDDGSNSNRHLALGVGGVSATVTHICTVLGSAQASMTSTSQNLTIPFKTAYGYRVDDFASVINAAAPLTDTLGTIPTVDRLNIGQGITGLVHINAPIRRIAYWPTRLPNATLQSLTT